ncbi:MAG TPA: hypothetical protein VHN77_12550 [Phycisphaerales bacterium]|nr:hypothetical protein [Phycisphaerales bacterium]
MATALPANLLLAAELMDRPVLARLLQSALAVLDEIARTSKDPLQRRLAATTIVKVVTQRPPTRPAHQPAPTPAAKPPEIPPVPIAHTTHPQLSREGTNHSHLHDASTVPLSTAPPTLRPFSAPPAPAAALLAALARSSAP